MKEKIQTLYCKKISTSYRILLLIFLSFFGIYNLYLQEYKIVFLFIFFTYLIFFQKEIYFTEKGLIKKYSCLFYKREEIIPFLEISKVEVKLSKKIVILYIYEGVLVRQLAIHSEKISKILEVFKRNKIKFTILSKNK